MKGLFFPVLISLLLLTASPAHCVYRRVEAFSINLGLSGLMAGLGAAFHGGSGHRVKKFIKGFYFGVIGGGLIWAGKNLAVESDGSNGAGWISKGMVSVGASVTENVFHGAAPLSGLYVDVGPLWLRYRPYRGLDAQVLPVSLVALVDTSLQPGARFDAGKTLRTGTVTFRTNRKTRVSAGRSYAFTNSILMHRNQDAFPHEVIHTYQWRQSLMLDGIYARKFEESKYLKYFRPELSGGLFSYGEQGLGYTPEKRNNFEEKEADLLY